MSCGFTTRIASFPNLRTLHYPRKKDSRKQWLLSAYDFESERELTMYESCRSKKSLSASVTLSASIDPYIKVLSRAPPFFLPRVFFSLERKGTHLLLPTNYKGVGRLKRKWHVDIMFDSEGLLFLRLHSSPCKKEIKLNRRSLWTVCSRFTEINRCQSFLFETSFFNRLTYCPCVNDPKHTENRYLSKTPPKANVPRQIEASPSPGHTYIPYNLNQIYLLF